MKEKKQEQMEEKCILSCNNKPVICQEHYTKLREYKDKVERKNDAKDNAIFILIMFIVLAPTIYWLTTIPVPYTIDESKFCLDKLNVNFPSYHFQKADYSSCSENNPKGECVAICTGYYNPSQPEQSDGLVAMQSLSTKGYILTDQTEKAYLAQDDSFFYPIMIIGICMIIGYFYIKDEW